MIPISKSQYIKNHIRTAESAFEIHEVLDRTCVTGGTHRLVIGRKDSSIYRVSFLLERRFLIMVGDLDTMVWAYCPECTIQTAIAWIGGHESPDQYILQKAQIGMSSVGCVEFVPEVAAYQITEHMAEEEEGHRSKWQELSQRFVNNRSEKELWDDIYDIFNDSELCDIGRCPSSRLLWAWSAVRKAHVLLSKDGK